VDDSTTQGRVWVISIAAPSPQRRKRLPPPFLSFLMVLLSLRALDGGVAQVRAEDGSIPAGTESVPDRY
jgi:hypothetical protein